MFISVISTIATITKASFSQKVMTFLLFLHENMLWVLIRSSLLMCTHNLCFHGEVRKIFIRYPFLSNVMLHHASFVPVILAPCFFFTHLHSYICSSKIRVKCQENLHLKMSSVYVVCCIFLQTFQTYFWHIGKQCGPRSDCSLRSSLIWVHTFCNNDF